jgi:hypothetical protein
MHATLNHDFFDPHAPQSCGCDARAMRKPPPTERVPVGPAAPVFPRGAPPSPPVQPGDAPPGPAAVKVWYHRAQVWQGASATSSSVACMQHLSATNASYKQPNKAELGKVAPSFVQRQSTGVVTPRGDIDCNALQPETHLRLGCHISDPDGQPV